MPSRYSGTVEISIGRSQNVGAEFYGCEISSTILKARAENPGAHTNRKRGLTIMVRCGPVRVSTPPLTTESPTTHYCTVQHHVPIDPYAERMPRAVLTRSVTQ